MPAPYTDVNVQYPQNMWDGVTTNQRPWYESQLYAAFVRNSVYNNFVSQEFNHNGVKATEMYIDAVLSMHANHSPLGSRQAWLDTSYMDSVRRKLTFKHYGGKISINDYDELISHWTPTLGQLASGGLGQMMTDTMEKLARDAFLDSPYKFFKANGSGTSFNDIGTSDTATAQMIRDIQLAADYRETPWSNNLDPAYPEVYCITTPGVIADIRDEAETTLKKGSWLEVQSYTESGRIAKLRGEVGALYGVRFIKSPNALLMNAGAWSAQTTITSPINAGDGAPDPSTTAVDGIEYVGQPGATHSITVASTTGINVNDWVTVHFLRTNVFGVSNGLDYRDGKAQNLRVVAKTSTTLTFARPVMEDFTTETATSSGIYGYVTKGRHIHPLTFVYGNAGVVRGVARPPRINNPMPIDDLGKIYRVSWDAYVGYTPFNKNDMETGFVAGSFRDVGAKVVQ